MMPTAENSLCKDGGRERGSCDAKASKPMKLKKMRYMSRRIRRQEGRSEWLKMPFRVRPLGGV